MLDISPCTPLPPSRPQMPEAYAEVQVWLLPVAGRWAPQVDSYACEALGLKFLEVPGPQAQTAPPLRTPPHPAGSLSCLTSVSAVSSPTLQTSTGPGESLHTPTSHPGPSTWQVLSRYLWSNGCP